jgi:hypothetical protein
VCFYSIPKYIEQLLPFPKTRLLGTESPRSIAHINAIMSSEDDFTELHEFLDSFAKANQVVSNNTLTNSATLAPNLKLQKTTLVESGRVTAFK